MNTIPVIDIFAGPGGLNEGFSEFSADGLSYDIRLSVEKDPQACETLRMRALYRLYRRQGRVPELYYEAIKGDTFALERLRQSGAWQSAGEHVKNWTLGQVEPLRLHRTIRDRLEGHKDWVLLGGPPCQVYSIIGRVSMKGTGAHIRNLKEREVQRQLLEDAFAADHRHKLYRQYLQIVALHEPAIFVMENVKGILSASLPVGRKRAGGWRYEPVFQRIMADLRDPTLSVKKDKAIKSLEGFPLRTKGARYRLYSFVRPVAPGEECTDPGGFVIECEKYGIPQTRHRVIILGVRQDLAMDKFTPLSASRKQVDARAVLEGLPKIRSRLSRDRETVRRYGEDSGENWCQAVQDSVLPKVISKLDPKIQNRIKKIMGRSKTNMSPGGDFVDGGLAWQNTPKDLREFIRDVRLGGLIQHESRSHMASDLGRYLYASASAEKNGISPTIEEWPLDLLPKHKNIRTSRKHQKALVNVFRDRFRVQVWNKAASTVTSHASKDGHYIIHPDPEQCRSLTVRELARIQTFPDNYYFAGSRTDQYQQVGNAVPPFLALKLAGVVSQLLRHNLPKKSKAKRRRR